MVNHGWVRRARARRGAGLGIALSLVLVVSACASSSGTWVATTPPTKGTAAGFEDVSCATATECLALGTYVDGGVTKVLAERWDGTTWTLLPDLPVPAGAGFGPRPQIVVDCATAQACIGAATVLVAGVATPVAARWDGTGWTPTSLAPFVAGSGVDDVSCASATWCLLIGDEGPTPTANRSQFAQRWDGTSWSAVASPIPSPENGTPADVRPQLSCPTPSFCGLANGWTTLAAQVGTTVELFDGTSWTLSPALPTGGGPSAPALLGLDCTGPTFCAGAGFRPGGTVIDVWDGTAWQDQSPVLAFVLPAVSCAAAGRCLVAGASSDAPSPGAPLGGYALEGLGQTWLATTPPSDPSARVVTGVSCVPGTGDATSCLVVGRSTTGATGSPLALRFQF